MAFEDFLRNSKLIHKYIMRTRKITHENVQYRKFLENSGLNAEDILNDSYEHMPILRHEDLKDEGVGQTTFHKISAALKFEQKRNVNLEAQIYVLRQDYHKLLNKIDSETSSDIGPEGKGGNV